MARAKDSSSDSANAFSVRFNLFSLVVFSAALIMASGGLVFVLLRSGGKPGPAPASAAPATGSVPADPVSATNAPWGELVTYDLELEHPDEYSSSGFEPPHGPQWFFDGLRAEQVRTIMLQCGLTSNQVAQAFAPHCFLETPTNTIIQPNPELVFSLPAGVRGNLYAGLAGSPANQYMYFPACFSGNSFDLTMYGSQVEESVIALIRPLLYQRGEATFFSDFEVVMARLPTEAQRTKLMKALSRQPAVIARIRIRPTTDIDKLLAYWTQAPGVRLKDLRPLLESVRRVPDGATISLLYFLPKFARERLYTSPLPPSAIDPKMDCHWSSMNFFHETPDDRYSDPAFVRERLEKDYYLVQRPGNYGDVIVLVDDQGNGIHSAVYIADDLVFTKNGENFVQPWMLMRLNHLVAKYSMRGTPRLAVYRNKAS